MLNHSRRIPDRIGASGAGCGNRCARTLQTEEDRYISTGGVDLQPWHGERTYATEPSLPQNLVLFFERLDAANAAADDHATARQVFFRKIQSRILYRADRGGDS